MTMTLIETKTLGTAAALIEFTSIPQDGTDLVALVSTREATTNDQVLFTRLNGDSGGNYTHRGLQGTGSAASSYTGANDRIDIATTPSNATSNTFGNAIIYITNYTSSVSKLHSSDSVAENNATAALSRLIAGLYTTTSPITSMTFTTVTGNIAAGSTISLYKITKGSSSVVVS
jgi:hypothetical protein